MDRQDGVASQDIYVMNLVARTFVALIAGRSAIQKISAAISRASADSACF